MNIHDLPVHPAAAAFPPLTDDEYSKLKSDIADVGLQNPVVVSTDGERLLDGVHRRRACQELGGGCPANLAPEGVDEIKLIVSLNSRPSAHEQRCSCAGGTEVWLTSGSRGGDRSKVSPETLTHQEACC